MKPLAFQAECRGFKSPRPLCRKRTRFTRVLLRALGLFVPRPFPPSLDVLRGPSPASVQIAQSRSAASNWINGTETNPTQTCVSVGRAFHQPLPFSTIDNAQGINLDSHEPNSKWSLATHPVPKACRRSRPDWKTHHGSLELVAVVTRGGPCYARRRSDSRARGTDGTSKSSAIPPARVFSWALRAQWRRRTTLASSPARQASCRKRSFRGSSIETPPSGVLLNEPSFTSQRISPVRTWYGSSRTLIKRDDFGGNRTEVRRRCRGSTRFARRHSCHCSRVIFAYS